MYYYHRGFDLALALEEGATCVSFVYFLAYLESSVFLGPSFLVLVLVTCVMIVGNLTARIMTYRMDHGWHLLSQEFKFIAALASHSKFSLKIPNSRLAKSNPLD